MDQSHKVKFLRGLILFLRDPVADWKPKAVGVLALLYVVWPLDLIPDVAPVIGWLDDLGFAVLASWYLAWAVKKYLAQSPTPTSKENDRKD